MLFVHCRYYQDRKEDKEGLDALVGLVQEKLKQAGFEDFNHIVDQCLHFDFQRFTVFSLALLHKCSAK